MPKPTKPTKRRIVFSGSRHLRPVEAVREALSRLDPRATLVIHGGAHGVDELVDQLARQMGFDVEVHQADWAQHGRAAGPIRNRQMLEGADGCWAFWDGKSRGTKDTISTARRLRVPVEVLEIDGKDC